MSRHPARRLRSWTCCTLMATMAFLACNALNGAGEFEVVDTLDAGRPVTPDGPVTAIDAPPLPTEADGPMSPTEPSVSFDAKGARDYGNKSTLAWSHTFGANANAVVISVSHEEATAPTVYVGSTVIPVLSGPTFTGKYLGYSGYHTIAAALVPTVAGTTQTVTVSFGSSRASSATSLSFEHVGSLGSVVTNGGGSGSGTASVTVNSSARSMVAVGFGGTASNFSGFDKTVAENFTFSPYVNWSHLIGHAQGASGLQFTANVGGDWQAKAIELQP